MKTAALNQQFAMLGQLHFEDRGPGLPVAHVTTAQASASIALHGGQLLSWQPIGQQPVIWLSKAALFESGKPVRGGVPVCWPWFGAVPDKPAHGFVRTRMWQMRAAATDAAGQMVLRLGISDDAETRVLWDHAFDLELVVTVGHTLTLALITSNTGDAPFEISQALHTYFCTSDITQTAVHGLDGCSFLDKVHGMVTGRQSGAVRFDGETDRIYFDTSTSSLIDDPTLKRTVSVSKSGSSSTVVWNPWSEKEKSFPDMAAGEYQQMLCVETCNAGPDRITIAPSSLHTLSAVISVDTMRL
ncbi:MAG: D-hexose-6-phosphate mutarotase [Rhodoferax sp.]|jgi:glucose-6-phosphate 1-epimerase|uniref:D-hexose-6-phosphate mutarotase n=1 Tax=Rhodoferax sp. TaxID=50421 RepID=UPI001B4499C3|nr:D-hexose-6-phosphate mutarotase [Rhodoferax sp.]MBP8287773.1 D-hexose-6-phosphate mutarotase [Rhodoferax sp.]MBP9147507.1 D-hexose-6-phosphate mutarotase [Rhodoferax sp.]MBP9734393.1 D-hexose-6-phosphate mutarotase [Rhodoferax sp.]